MKARKETIKLAIEAAKRQLFEYQNFSGDFKHKFGSESKIETFGEQKAIIQELEYQLNEAK